MAIQKLGFAELRVTNLEAALSFYQGIMGLTPFGQHGQTYYFGCGLDETIDLAVTPGGTGVVRFAFQCESEEDLTQYAAKLRAAGVTAEERTESDPTVRKSLRFQLPSGHTMELVVFQEQRPYLRPAAPARAGSRNGITPNDVDHVTLSVHAPRVRTLAEFLRDVLDFKISDIFQPAPDVWAAVWTRVGEWHHDLAMLGGEDPSWTLHHLAWTLQDIDHIKRFVDVMCAAGVRVEYGIGRHGLGSNLYCYFFEPGGNRFELTAEMPRAVQQRAEPLIWTDFPEAASAYGVLPPESFGRGT